VNHSRIRHALGVPQKKHNGQFASRRRRKVPAMTTRQWLVLTFSVAVLVGVIFVLTVYYGSGR